MRNFTYTSIEIGGMCTVLPKNSLESEGFARSVSIKEQTTSDLGFIAAQRIIKTSGVDVESIGVLIFLTKTADYRGPATAMVLQNRLEIPTDCIVYDVPNGNGGFETAVNIGMSLLSTSSKKHALVIFGDTVSKQLNPVDLGILNLQDGATAVLLENAESNQKASISTMTLSNHWSAFMVPSGGFRNNASVFEKLKSKRPHQTVEHLHLDNSSVSSAIAPELMTIKSKVAALVDTVDSPDLVVLVNLLDAQIENELALLFQSETFRDRVYLSHTYGTPTMASTVPLMIAKVFREKELEASQVISVSIGEGLSVTIANLVLEKSAVLESLYSDSYFDNGFVTHEM